MSKPDANPESRMDQVEWEVEELYFGNATTPSWVFYRKSGERIQYRDELGLPLTLREGTHQYDANAEEVAEFLEGYEDCQFTVADSYELSGGGRQGPSLWVTGWRDLPEDERHIYEQDKEDAWKNPDEA